MCSRRYASAAPFFYSWGCVHSMHKNVCVALATPIVFCCLIVIFFFEGLPALLLGATVPFKKKKKV